MAGTRTRAISAKGTHPVDRVDWVGGLPTPTSSRTPKTDNEIRCHYCPKAITAALSATHGQYTSDLGNMPLVDAVVRTHRADQRVCLQLLHDVRRPARDTPSVWTHAVEIAVVTLLLGGAAVLLDER